MKSRIKILLSICDFIQKLSKIWLSYSSNSAAIWMAGNNLSHKLLDATFSTFNRKTDLPRITHANFRFKVPFGRNIEFYFEKLHFFQSQIIRGN